MQRTSTKMQTNSRNAARAAIPYSGHVPSRGLLETNLLARQVAIPAAALAFLLLPVAAARSAA